MCSIVNDNNSRVGYFYRCKICRKKLTATTGTLFFECRLTCKEVLHIILCFVAGLSHKQAVIEAKVDKNTITDWFGYLREVQWVIMSQPRKIGGLYEDENGDIFSDFVEVDESQICNRKYFRGRLLKTETERIWIVGGVCRRTRQAFMVKVPNRRINVIDYLLRNRLEEGSILVTDCARIYDNVPKRLDIEYYSVNHSLHFVCPKNKDVNTNMIESRWAGVKKKFKSYKNTNYIESFIAQYLYEFEFLNPLKDKFSYVRFKKLVNDIVRVYPVPDPQSQPLLLLMGDWEGIDE